MVIHFMLFGRQIPQVFLQGVDTVVGVQHCDVAVLELQELFQLQTIKEQHPHDLLIRHRNDQPFSNTHCTAVRVSSPAFFRLSLRLMFSRWVSIVWLLRKSCAAISPLV